MSLQVSCPQCKGSVLMATESMSVSCGSCGHEFSLERSADATDDYRTLVVSAAEPPAVAMQQTRFALIDRIGEGSFGSVWKAWDSQLQRHVALKLPRVDNLPAQELAEFLLDAKAVAQLDHSHIVRVFDITLVDKQTAIVSELVEGSDLRNYLSKQKGLLTFQLTAELIAKIAVALHHAHTRGIIHRDLKPGNVMMTRELEPKVIDFGLARREKHEGTRNMAGFPVGTPAYMPPEQARGESNTADGRADIYSLGIMLFEMLTGNLPFRGVSVKDVLAQHISAEPPRPGQLNTSVPISLETICLKCLHKEPSRRFQTAQDVADELRRWLEGKPILSRPVSWMERFWMLCRRNPRHSAAYGAAVAACVVILVVSFVRITVARNRERVAKEKAEHSLDLALARLTDAREAVDLWLTTVGEQLRFVPGLTHEREQLLKLAEQDYAKFTSQATDDPNLELERGRVLLRLGQVRRALGTAAAARESFEQARQLFERLSLPVPESSSAVVKRVPRTAHLALCDVQIWLALLSRDAGAVDQADVELQSAAQRLEQLRASEGGSPALDEALAVALFNRGALWLQKGKLATAQPMIEQANQLFTSLRGVNRANRRLDSLAAGGLELMGAAAREAGQYEAADRYTKSAVEILKGLVDAESWNLDTRAQHARATLQHAAIMQQLGREREELADIEAAIVDYESVTQSHPELSAYQQELVLALIDAARLRLSQGHLSQAEALLGKTESPLQGLRQQETQGALAEQLMAHSYDVRGQVLLGLGQTTAGLEHVQRAQELFTELVVANPEFPELKLAQALTQLHRAQGLEQQTDPVQTEQAYQLAVKTIQSLIDREQSTAEQQYVAAYIAAAYADFRYASQAPVADGEPQLPPAMAESTRALKLWENLITKGRPAPEHVLEYSQFLLVHSDEKLRDPAQALQRLEQLKPVLPTSAKLFQLRGLALIRLQRFAEAEESIRQAIRYRGEEDARDLYCLSMAQRGLKQAAAAKATLDKATSWQDQFAPALPILVRLRTEATRAPR